MFCNLAALCFNEIHPFGKFVTKNLLLDTGISMCYFCLTCNKLRTHSDNRDLCASSWKSTERLLRISRQFRCASGRARFHPNLQRSSAVSSHRQTKRPQDNIRFLTSSPFVITGSFALVLASLACHGYNCIHMMNPPARQVRKSASMRRLSGFLTLKKKDVQQVSGSVPQQQFFVPCVLSYCLFVVILALCTSIVTMCCFCR